MLILHLNLNISHLSVDCWLLCNKGVFIFIVVGTRSSDWYFCTVKKTLSWADSWGEKTARWCHRQVYLVAWTLTSWCSGYRRCNCRCSYRSGCVRIRHGEVDIVCRWSWWFSSDLINCCCCFVPNPIDCCIVCLLFVDTSDAILFPLNIRILSLRRIAAQRDTKVLCTR